MASVPEPGSITLLVCGAAAGLLWWKRGKQYPLSFIPFPFTFGARAQSRRVRARTLR
ncbi:MAG: PEP-CTERM sorting domain-containing protein [Pirellulales bacterium]|nr:PEP-CTERM sorting domain-containing protein [Pirellulales bacterium]